MDETYFDEGPAGNFETATLEITKELDVNELNSQNTVPVGADTAKKNRENKTYTSSEVPSSKDLSNIPFKHIDIHSFFSDRNEVVDRALKDCQESLINEEENDIIGSWLLTEISLWDIEKERLVILSKKAIYSIKYDFISLKILEYNRIPLLQIDTLISGELVYPPSSLAPKRHMSGIRLMWNKGNPVPLTKKWNPFAKDIPWLTYASHPLFWYKGSEVEKARFNVEGLQSLIKNFLPSDCITRNGLIIIENYFGVGALVHNRNGLGFYKIRGKVSF
ncbi:tumor protein p63-regulated gene 1-like protein isoform X2 [Bombus vancouverensis nearcticus]|uniref:Tumor protein p63-regulated gene 1-like protein isoform X2 n=1 Tax=Bombus bifarius TaxID=103933 RepID=A0A6P8NJT0_9HYME|nr:tumor protein p63-regulated gene 1-like protein isoform X2 [Bombus vancouverensis nearcticus]XP_033320254.1 tumor protein p63-regulated gene 1-like protein isoform X2 [Bombus bifarius]